MTTEITSTGTQTHTQTRTRTSVRTTKRSPLTRLLLAIAALFRRVGRFLARARSEISRTVTAAGWVAVVVAAGGIGLGWAFGWHEWVIAGIVAVALLILSLPFLFGARAYSVTVEVGRTQVVAGGSVPARIGVSNTSKRFALPGRLDLPVGSGLIEVPVPLLRGGADFQHSIDIPTPRRGIIDIGPAAAVRSDPVGLLRREHEWPDVHEVRVHPRTAQVPSTSAGLIRDLEGNPTVRLVDSDMAFHAIREYAPGDSRRQVHWKSTAKTGQLMVRQYEQTRRSRMAVALSVANDDYADADEYELAVSVAASLSVRAMRDGREVNVVAGADIPQLARGRVRAIRQLGALSAKGLLDEFCAVDSLDSTPTLEDVCAMQAEEDSGLSIAFVVCGSKVGLERVRRAALAYALDTSVVAVICDQSAQPRIRPISDLTVMTVGVLDDLPALVSRGMSA